MSKKRVLIPLPSYGFDPTEAAIPWKLMSESGFEIIFITPDGKKAAADRLMVTGKRLGIWKLLLQARQDAVDAYHQMEKTESFNNPLKYTDVQEQNFDAILLPGGHDKSIREYLESKVLQQLIVDFFIAQKPVGAICHGVVLAARSINPETGKSVIHDYKTTSLLKLQEMIAYYLTRLWLHDYFLTYPEITVEDEVKTILSDSNNFLKGPLPGLRDSLKSLKRGFFARDRNYLSARWPGDAYNFSLELISMIETMQSN